MNQIPSLYNHAGEAVSELGKEFCGTSNECYDAMDNESEKRTLELIRKNAKAGKPFFCGILGNSGLPKTP